MTQNTAATTDIPVQDDAPDDEKLTGARVHFLFMNMGHFLDHLFMLIFSTVAAVVLVHDWGLSYAALIPYATPGFIAFAAFTLPAGWLADRFGREKLMVVFFLGCGFASILCALATTPVSLAVGLFVVGMFAAIYHPVGIALVLEGRSKTGLRVASNGVWGNLGVAVAALLTGALIDIASWRSAFIVPGVFSILLGIVYARKVQYFSPGLTNRATPPSSPSPQPDTANGNDKSIKGVLGQSGVIHILAIVLITTACGGIVFQSTTFALPRVLLEKTGDMALNATFLGWMAFIVFAIGSLGQLIVGFLLDRGSARRVFIACALLQVTFFVLAVFAEGWWVPLVAAGFMLAAFGQIPINDVLVGRVTDAMYRSRVLAVRYTVTLSTMAMSIPLIAWLHATGGVNSLFVMLAIIAAVISVCTFFLPDNV